jgi:peptidoglycan/LPS O-acetylase OafA/YrhL
VITHASYEKLQTKESLLVFVVRRFGRLWPMHFFILLCLIGSESVKLLVTTNSKVTSESGAFAVGTQYGWDSIASHIFMLQGWYANPISTWNGPSWSISNEFYVYILFALLALFARRWLIPASLAIITASLYYLYRVQPDMTTTFDFGSLRCLAGFFTGHLVYKLWQWKPNLLWLPVFTEILGVLLIVFFPIAAGFNGFSLLAPLYFGIIVWIFAYQAGPVSKLLMTPPLQFLGMLSYSIYISHWFILLCFKRTISFAEKILHTDFTIMYSSRWIPGSHDELFYIGNPWIMDGIALGYVVSLLIFSTLAYKFIEDPSRRYFNRLSQRFLTDKK